MRDFFWRVVFNRSWLVCAQRREEQADEAKASKCRQFTTRPSQDFGRIDSGSGVELLNGWLLACSSSICVSYLKLEEA